MSFQNDREAYALAHTYGFWPVPDGKYEPDEHPDADKRWMILAQFIPATNILILYNPDLHFEVPYNVSNGLDPDATGNYVPESGYNDKLTFVGPDREFFIWWDGVDSWIINEQIGHTDAAFWKQTDPSIIGAYAPQAGAIGVATVAAGPG